MATVMTNKETERWFIDTFGLPDHTIRFTLTAAVDSITTIECEYYLDIKKEELITKQFYLSEIPEDNENDKAKQKK